MIIYKYILFDKADTPCYQTYSLYDLALKILEIIEEINKYNIDHLYVKSVGFNYHVEVEKIESRLL